MLRKILLAAVAAIALLSTASAAEARGCWTPNVAGFNTVQVCVLDDDILK